MTHRNFIPAAPGVYFMQRDGNGASFHLLDVTTSKARKIGATPRPVHNGLSLSQDGQWLAYTQFDQFGSDISLVENFR